MPQPLPYGRFLRADLFRRSISTMSKDQIVLVDGGPCSGCQLFQVGAKFSKLEIHHNLTSRMLTAQSLAGKPLFLTQTTLQPSFSVVTCTVVAHSTAPSGTDHDTYGQ